MRLLPLVSELKIKTKDLQIVRFGDVMNYAQRDLIEECERQLRETGQIRVVVLKARQMGLSTAIEAILFSLAFVVNYFRVLIVSHEMDSSQHILSMCDTYWRTFFAHDLYTTKYAGRKEMQWVETHSGIRVDTAGGKGVGRSQTIAALHASEVAFWPNPEELVNGLRQAIPSFGTTAIFYESTANGVGNWFHRTWKDAVAGRNELAAKFYPWWQHPEYTASFIGEGEAAKYGLDERSLTSEERVLREMGVSDARLVWRRWAIQNLCGGDLDKFHQEYPACVVAGTRVATERGLVPVESIRPGDWTPYGRVLAVHEQPPARCVRITTASGFQLESTWHHPMVVESGLLVPAEATLGQTLQLAELQFADEPAEVVWSDGLVESAVRMTDDLALFAGYFMGDGYFSSGALSVVCDGADEDVVGEVTHLLGAMGLAPRVREVGSKGGGREVRAEAKRLVEPFRRLGFTRDAGNHRWVRHVQVPEVIWRSTRRHVRLFLAGLFEADGFSNRKQWDVRLFTRYERFARDVQLLLAGFGIHARVREEKGWVVSLSSAEAEKFHELIGFRSARKRAAVPRAKAQRMRGNPLEVISVEEIGALPTYDLSIEDRPYYGANGLLTHNTPDEAFISTGRNVFPLQRLLAHYRPQFGVRGRLARLRGKLEFVECGQHEGGVLRVFNYPSSDVDWGTYIIGADPTHTTTGDYACAQVLNRRTLEQVAVYRKKCDPITFAEDLKLLAEWYNSALIVPEKEGPGYATVGHLVGSGYPNVWQSERVDSTRGKGMGTYGWSTTKQSKHLAISNLLKMVVDDVLNVNGLEYGLIIHDDQTITEMRDYVTAVNGDGYENSDGSEYDDGVMALATAVTVHHIEPQPAAYGLDESMRAARMSVRPVEGPDGEDTGRYELMSKSERRAGEPVPAWEKWGQK